MMTAFWIALSVVLAWFAAITAYIVVTATKKIRDEHGLGVLPWWVKGIVVVWLGIGAVIDAFMHYVWATVWQLDLPAKGEHLLTSRLKRYKATNDKRLARAEKNWGWLNLYERDHW